MLLRAASATPHAVDFAAWTRKARRAFELSKTLSKLDLPCLQTAGAASRSPGPSQSAAGTSSRDLRSNTASKTRSLVMRGGSSAPQASGASTRSRRAPGRACKPSVKAVEAAGTDAATQPQLPPAAASAVAAASPDTPQLAAEGCGTDQLVFNRRKLEQQMVRVYGIRINRTYVWLG